MKYTYSSTSFEVHVLKYKFSSTCICVHVLNTYTQVQVPTRVLGLKYIMYSRTWTRVHFKYSYIVALVVVSLVPTHSYSKILKYIFYCISRYSFSKNVITSTFLKYSYMKILIIFNVLVHGSACYTCKWYIRILISWIYVINFINMDI